MSLKLVDLDLVLCQILWTFSIYLESVAILPQLFLVSKTGEAESITSHYLFALGSYRALYLLNWIYRYYVEVHYDLIAIVAGVVQTVLYCDFFYLYITKGESDTPLFASSYSFCTLLRLLLSVHHERPLSGIFSYICIQRYPPIIHTPLPVSTLSSSQITLSALCTPAPPTVGSSTSVLKGKKLQLPA
uniref:ER lumen protein-retaining receptor n=1 Tax=Timema shepardi TaxID=629360 RepID=A0A7R9BB45_TIMSH|nr:unnamed protein product [Timema shepardi]